jgi:hypothetical protein
MATELRVHTCIEMVSRKDVYTSLQSLKILYGYLQTTFHLLWTVLKKSDRLDKQCGGVFIDYYVFVFYLIPFI